MYLKPVARLIRSPFAAVVLRPWFDRAALAVLAKWVFPAWRLWAAAEAGGFDLARVLAANPRLVTAGRGARRLARRLARVQRLKGCAADAEARWDALFFDGAHATEAARLEADRARRAGARALLASHMWFAKHAYRAAVEAVLWNVPSQAEVETEFGRFLDAPALAFLPPDPLPAVEASARIATGCGIEYALRFRSPSPWIMEPGFARVIEPAGAMDPPTLIQCHGVAVEAETLGAGLDEVLGLVEKGVRLVRPVAPWHGRRRLAGTWSGEPFLSRVPLGSIALLAGLVREVGVLVGWSRATSRGKVAIGGISLGALAAQLAAIHMEGWPQRLRSDAALLVGISDRLDRLAFEGALARALGMDRALDGAGWTPGKLQPWRALSDPQGKPALDPAAIVMALGTADDITPYDGGLALADAWGVPEPNRFRRRQGHFSLALGLIRDDAPLRRLAAILG
ncbi:MAG: hypothetical protein ACT4P2_12445 [Pseudomonadota bacterium]